MSPQILFARAYARLDIIRHDERL